MIDSFIIVSTDIPANQEGNLSRESTIIVVVVYGPFLTPSFDNTLGRRIQRNITSAFHLRVVTILIQGSQRKKALREQEIGYNIGILLGEIILLVYVDVGVKLINR